MHLRAYFLVGVFAVISLWLFIASLPMPALFLQGEKPVTGQVTLVAGYWGLLLGQLAWFANPVYLAALVGAACRKWNVAIVLMLIALGMGATSYFVDKWYIDERRSVAVLSLGRAFYFWMGSFVALLAGVLLAKRFG